MKKSMRGFSLVELMVATAVLTVSGAGAIALVANMSMFDRDSRMRTQATALAEETVNMLFGVTGVARTDPQWERALVTWPSPMDSTATGVSCAPACAGTASCQCTSYVWVLGGRLKRKVTIGAVGSGVTAGVQSVTVQVFWSNRGLERSSTFKAALARP